MLREQFYKEKQSCFLPVVKSRRFSSSQNKAASSSQESTISTMYYATINEKDGGCKYVDRQIAAATKLNFFNLSNNRVGCISLKLGGRSFDQKLRSILRECFVDMRYEGVKGWGNGLRSLGVAIGSWFLVIYGLNYWYLDAFVVEIRILRIPHIMWGK